MKTVKLTDRELIILGCLINIDRINREQENWKLDRKSERFTDVEIQTYDNNVRIINELSILTEKLIN